MKDAERSEESSINSEDVFVITNRQIFLISINLINHLLILFTVGFTLYVAAIDAGLSYATNKHAFFCTIGYPLLMAEAIVALAGENTWTFCLSRRGNSHLHWILQVIGAMCTFYGCIVEYLDKNVTTRPDKTGHFSTLHGILGIISVAAISIVFLSGLPALFAGTLRKKIKPVLSKFTHNSLGIFCFVTGMAAQFTAYSSKRWLKQYRGETMVIIVSVFTCLITLFSLMGALRQLHMQFKGTLRVIKN